MTAIERKLREDLDHCAAQLASADEAERSARARVERLRDRLEYIRSVLGEEETRPASRSRVAVQPNGHPYYGLSASAVVRSILQEAGGPMHIRAIAERAIQMGYGGPNAHLDKVIPNMSSLLAKARRRPEETGFKKVGRGLFDLTVRQSGQKSEQAARP